MSLILEKQGTASVPLAAKIVLIILAGLLSMFFAEVFSGSSPLWFLSPWGVIVTLPLYLGHLLLFVNLAMIFRRTSLTSLYLWGAFFGLYESWITKVLWAGYPSASAPLFGTFLGLGIYETLVLVFFWHPVVSFMMPILTYEALSGPGSGRIFTSHLPLLARRRRNWAIFISLALVGSLLLTAGTHANLMDSDATIAGSLLLILIFYRLASSRYAGHFSVYSLRLGRIGFSMLVAYLSFLYILGFLFILPQRIAPPITIAATVAVYGFVAFLQYLTKPNAEGSGTNLSNLFGRREAGYLALLLLVATSAVSFFYTLDYVAFFIISFGLFLLGCALLAFSITKIVREQLKRAGSTADPDPGS